MLLPNLPFQTLGGTIYWNTVTFNKGWKIQQHRISQHYRVLDPMNIRHAWSHDFATIQTAFDELTQNNLSG